MSTLYAIMDILNINTNLIQLFTQMLNVKVLSREEPFYLIYSVEVHTPGHSECGDIKIFVMSSGLCIKILGGCLIAY